ncbi:MAG: hypothetical protein K2X29_01400 [Candidatus Obscuribacterales bacterium]|nr:hypothetical protein [Candidatus Obscuribacterales bacterium]
MMYCGTTALRHTANLAIRKNHCAIPPPRITCFAAFLEHGFAVLLFCGTTDLRLAARQLSENGLRFAAFPHLLFYAFPPHSFYWLPLSRLSTFAVYLYSVDPAYRFSGSAVSMHSVLAALRFPVSAVSLLSGTTALCFPVFTVLLFAAFVQTSNNRCKSK